MTASLIARIILAVIVGVVVYLLAVLVGGLLVDLKIDFAVTVGEWLRQYGSVLGLLAGLWYFFAGGSWRLP